MTKIAIDARELRGTGTGTYLKHLLDCLQDMDEEHEYNILLKPDDYDSWEPNKDNFTKTRCPYAEFSFAEQVGFLTQLNELGADLVHFPMAQQPVFYDGKVVTAILDLTTARFRNPAKNPAVFWIKQQVYKWVIKKVARKSVRLITISEFVKNDLVNFTDVPQGKIDVTYPAAEKITDKSQPIVDLAGREFLMYVGRPLPHKNLKRLIEAFKIVNENNPDLILVCAGKKDVLYEQAEAYAKRLGVTDSLRFTGFVTNGELRWLYENTVAYVFPSLSEGFGLPGLEAMAHGAPVASSNATCLPEIYGDAAIYFDPYDITDMVAKLQELLSDEKFRKELVDKGKKQVAKYSWRRMTEQTLEVYKRALAE